MSIQQSRGRVAVVTAVAGALMAGGATPAGAADPARIGVGIQAQPVVLAGSAEPGHDYTFPTVYVINKGQATEAVRLGLEARGTGRVPPAEWLTLATPSVTLAAGQTAHLPVLLHLPPSAEPGSYQTAIIAMTQTPGFTGEAGARLGAAAATTLSFTVAAPPAATGRTTPWWAYSILGAGGLMAATAWAVRRLGIRIHVTRQT